jgi:tetratricopeptide (TPR) repeat protein
LLKLEAGTAGCYILFFIVNQTSPETDQGTPSPQNWRVMAAICIFLAVLVWMVFGQTRSFDFVNFDDGKYVTGNPSVMAGVTAKDLASAFGAGAVDNWMPLTMISYMADCQLYGLKAEGYHLTNVLLHMGAVIFLFLALVKMTHGTSSGTREANLLPDENIWRCAFVAAVFAVHPLRAESVAWVAERKDVLCGFFFALTLWAYAGYANARISPGRLPHRMSWYLITLVFCAFALMSKPMAVTLPFVLLFLDYWPLGRFPSTLNEVARNSRSDNSHSPLPSPTRRTVLQLITEKVPFLLLSAATCFATTFFQKHIIANAEIIPTTIRIENAIVSYVVYIWELFYPVQLAVFYHYPIQGLPFRETVLAFLFLATITVMVVIWRRRLPYLLVGWFWYGIMLVPVIGFVQVGSQAHADRYTYLPGIGLCLLLTWLGADLCRQVRHRLLILGSVSAIIIASLILGAHAQVSYWRNSEVLWEHALDCDRYDVWANYSLGSYFNSEKRWDDAMTQFKQAIKYDPKFAAAYYNLGLLYSAEGDFDDAATQFQETLKNGEDDAKTHNNLGTALRRQGRLDDAIIQYQAALKLDPGHAPAHYNLGNVLLQDGRVNDAILEYEAALKLKPDNVMVQNNVARTIWTLATSPDAVTRNGANAVAFAQTANQLAGGSNPLILRALAAAYAESGNFSKAVETGKQARNLAMEEQKPALQDALGQEISLYQAGSPMRADPTDMTGW